MSKSLEEAFSEASVHIINPATFVRAVLSGRRRNMQTEFERIDIRPVEIKGSVKLQISHNDGRATTTKNIDSDPLKITELLESGYANILVEHIKGSISIRITKSGEAHVSHTSKSLEQNLNHDKKKQRLLDPADPFLLEVGIADHKGAIKPSKPTETNPLTIVDLGCGHAYLTFAAHQYLRSIGIPVHVTGIDVRTSSRDRNNKIAQNLGISETINFKAEEIASTTAQTADVVIALHACDTATDDAIAWAVMAASKLMLIAPCCHHDIQRQMSQSPEPWGALTKFGLMKERLGDLLTDSLRAQLLRIVGYRVEVIEFISGEHTPRNMMIRAVKTDAKAEAIDIQRYREICEQWGITPALEKKLPSLYIG